MARAVKFVQDGTGKVLWQPETDSGQRKYTYWLWDSPDSVWLHPRDARESEYRLGLYKSKKRAERIARRKERQVARNAPWREESEKEN